MTAAKELAYAKINLFLDVIAKRPDGFHDIKTVMHSISLCDEVSVSVAPSGNLAIKLEVDGGGFLPTDEKNLAFKAAKLFYEKVGKKESVEIKLKKNIPICAGLAGGSSDAAAVLRALNKIHKHVFTTKALAELGAQIGSDVPYCVFGKTALCEGRGEIITPIVTNAKYNIVVAASDEHVSTPLAYAALDGMYSNFTKGISTGGADFYAKTVSALAEGKIDKEGAFNAFEQAVLPTSPKAAAAKIMLLDNDADMALMSGSGPSVFGLFESRKKAEKAKQKLERAGYHAWLAKSV